MAKKEKLTLTKEEADLIRLRRIRAEEAKRQQARGRRAGFSASEYEEYDEQEQEERRRSERRAQRAERARKEKLRKKRRRKKIALIVLIAILAVVVGTAVIIVKTPGAKTALVQATLKSSAGKSILSGMIGDDYAESVMDPNFEEKNIVINAGAVIPDGYKNVALFGVDARGSEIFDATHTDTIMVMSANDETNEVKTASVFRDTCLKMEGYDGSTYIDRANVAYFIGGADMAINMLNTCFDLDITDYIVINFSGIANIVDALGGIEVDVEENEVEYVNYYMLENRIVLDSSSPDITGPGKQVLDGCQATAYCRIRYTHFIDKDTGDYISDDYGRTARQRYVLGLIIKKAKEAGLTSILNTTNVMIKENMKGDRFIATSLDIDEAADLIAACLKLDMKATTGFPVEHGDYSGMVVPADLEYNAALMHEKLFGQENYSCSSRLKNVSEELSMYTGVYRQYEEE